jgi:hypothetical protein
MQVINCFGKLHDLDISQTNLFILDKKHEGIVRVNNSSFLKDIILIK